MEHRYSTRFSADLKALIFKNGMPVAIGRIRNFSRSGIFIKTEFDLINVNQLLEIEVIARGSSRSPGYYSAERPGARKFCKTFVMHKANGGIGLLVREDCAETQEHFAALVADELARNGGADALLYSAALTASATPAVAFATTDPRNKQSVYKR